MSSNLPELPGFYYDHERKRYFRIMNTGQATSQASNDYSISAIADIRRRKRKKNLENMTVQNEQKHGGSSQNPNFFSPYSYPHNYTIRKHLLGSPLQPRVNRFTQNATLISSLTKKAHWSLEMSSPSDNLNRLNWCQKEKMMIMGTKQGKCSLIPGLEMLNDSCLSLTPTFPSSSSYYYPIESFNSEITSLSLSGNTVVNTCLGGPASTGAFSCSILKPYTDRGIIFKLPDHQNAFCSAVCEDNTGPNTFIAIGANSCAYCIQPNISGFYKEPFQTASDVMAVEFLKDSSYTNPLIVAGCRNGSINIFDPKLPSRHLTPTSPIIQGHHRSAITYIKSIQDKYILVSGVEDSLALYDLRYMKSHSNNANTLTTPTITYNGYFNSYTLNHGFAVDTDNRNFAIASENNINVYNIWTGIDITGNQLKDYKFTSNVAALQWTPLNGLFIGFGCNLEYWSWSSFADEIE